MSNLSGGAKCVKYTLFIINLLFLLAALALIIVGAIVQVQGNKNGFGDSVSGAGIFIIVIGAIVFVVCFFGCAGAINNNYCMVVTYGVLLLILLLAEVAGIITGFVLKDKIQDTVTSGMEQAQKEYGDNRTIATQTWDKLQKSLECCGTTNFTSWNNSNIMRQRNEVPDSCCNATVATICVGQVDTLVPGRPELFWKNGCASMLSDLFRKSLIAVGAVTAAIAILEVIGIILAFCLASSLKKDYRVV